MSLWQEMVREFHVAMGHELASVPTVKDPTLALALLNEEAGETELAMLRGDLPETADGLVDMIYVAIGVALTRGIDLDPLFAEVHRKNMEKVGGPIRADGKRLKPPGWLPPDVAGLLVAQGWRRP